MRLTDDQTIYRGEFVPDVEPSRPNSALLILLPCAAGRVRLVCFDVVIDAHEDSDVEIMSS